MGKPSLLASPMTAHKKTAGERRRSLKDQRSNKSCFGTISRAVEKAVLKTLIKKSCR
jgi:hypothetical protein